MRHTSIQTTMNVYGRAMTDSKRQAEAVQDNKAFLCGRKRLGSRFARSAKSFLYFVRQMAEHSGANIFSCPATPGPLASRYSRIRENPLW